MYGILKNQVRIVPFLICHRRLTIIMVKAFCKWKTRKVLNVWLFELSLRTSCKHTHSVFNLPVCMYYIYT